VRRIYLAAAVAATAGVASADPTIVGGAGATLDDARLIASGGEVLARGPDGRWRRRAGGVAIELVAVWGHAPDEQLAVGTRPPVFRHDGESWLTIAGLRAGAATLAARDAPRAGLAIGSRVYLLQSAKSAHRWTPLPAAPGAVAALWTRGPAEALAIVDGALLRLGKPRRKQPPWTPIALPHPAVALGGAEPLVIDAAGGVHRVAGGRARALRVEPSLRPRRIWGRIVDAGVLARIDGDAIVPLGDPPPGEVAIVLELASGYLVATRDGRVFTGSPGAWSEDPVDLGPPPPRETPPGAAPALTPTRSPE
jgi:hypothetical protein